jgi:tetratricopeptide (TPR) repeat protein
MAGHGIFEFTQGEPEAARELLDRGAELMRLQHLLRAVAWTDLTRAEVYAALGRFDQARELLERAGDEMQRLGEPGGGERCDELRDLLQSPLSSR